MTKDKWDGAYDKLQADDDDAYALYLEDITDATICGRLSMLVQAERLLSEGASLDQYLETMYDIIAQEVSLGKVDKNTFILPDAKDLKQ